MTEARVVRLRRLRQGRTVEPEERAAPCAPPRRHGHRGAAAGVPQQFQRQEAQGLTRSASRRRARSPARAATASASARGARTASVSARGWVARAATASVRVATDRSSKQPDVRAGEPATSRTSAEPDRRADLLEVLLRVDAEVKATMPPSLRRAMAPGSAQFATASRKRTA